jgi:hypothetical protein
MENLEVGERGMEGIDRDERDASVKTPALSYARARRARF